MKLQQMVAISRSPNAKSEHNRQPLVSVVLIFLNEEQFIEEAIDSLFAQTYDHWELLLVDDGSTDKSTAIAQHYAKQAPEKVRYLEHEGHQNQGMSASRNLGINHARGKYLAFLDADDVYLPHKLEQQVDLMASHPEAALVCGQAEWWYGWTGNPQNGQRDFVQKLDVPLNTLVKPPTLLLLFLQDEWASLCDVMVRREAVEGVGGYEECFRGMYEDQAFHVKLCLAYSAFVSSECWYRYRQHPASCCYVVEAAGQRSAARQAFLHWLEAYLSKQKLPNSEVWQVVQKDLWPYRHPLLFRISVRLQRLTHQMKAFIKQVGHLTLPVRLRQWLWTQWVLYTKYSRGSKVWPPVGWVRFGSLRRVTPIDGYFGLDRGLPVDRYYIEKFLHRHAQDIQGHVLELSDATYTRQFGGERVTQSDVLHSPIGKIGPQVTIVADLTCADQIPSATFDCIILTQTLLFIYDLRAAIETLYRILKPGGILLVTVPGISQIARKDMETWGEYWRFTKQSARRLFEEVFPAPSVAVEVYGNVLAAAAFLYGLAVQDLRQKELDYCDPDYEVIITVRAVKPMSESVKV